MERAQSIRRMPGLAALPEGGEDSSVPLSAEEFARHYQSAARTLWTIAAGMLGSSSEAEDVIQEACLMAFQRRKAFQAGTNFTAWISRFVRFVALNHARKGGRRRGVQDRGVHDGEARLDASLPVDGRGELRADQEDFDDRIVGGLRSLAAIPRACLLLRAVLELEYREIAAVLEIPEGTAMSHVHRSRMALQRWVRSEAEERA